MVDINQILDSKEFKAILKAEAFIKPGYTTWDSIEFLPKNAFEVYFNNSISKDSIVFIRWFIKEIDSHLNDIDTNVIPDEAGRTMVVNTVSDLNSLKKYCIELLEEKGQNNRQQAMQYVDIPDCFNAAENAAKTKGKLKSKINIAAFVTLLMEKHILNANTDVRVFAKLMYGQDISEYTKPSKSVRLCTPKTQLNRFF